MPQYDYRCKCCQRRFALFYKTYALYESAQPRCPNCESAQLSRLITQVAIAKSNRNYAQMSSQEMLSVLESGDPRQANEMFQQVSETDKKRTSSQEEV